MTLSTSHYSERTRSGERVVAERHAEQVGRERAAVGLEREEHDVAMGDG